jgi:dienelactone hydrolase
MRGHRFARSATVVALATATLAASAGAAPPRPGAASYRAVATATLHRYAARLDRAARAAGVTPARLTAAGPTGVDTQCLAPAPDPAFGTAAWELRDTFNQYCATLRLRDQLDNPAFGYADLTKGATLYADQAQQQLADGPGHLHGGITTLVPGSQAADALRTLDRWQALTGGRVKRITLTAADGAQLKGHVFLPPKPSHGPDGRYPGVVITDGSVQAYEQLYYWAAEGLAEAGYEVMTYDVQGQGDSDLLGAKCVPSLAQLEALSVCPGVPYQQSYNFYQGAEDSLGWFDSLENPYFAQLDPNRIGIAGHSLGAAAVSEVGQCDTRVKTIVAWDDLGAIKGCTGGGETIAPQHLNHGPLIRVPALALTNDYLFNPQPQTSVPDPNAKDAGYEQVVTAGQDSMIVTFRGATHLTYTYIPLVLPASELAERFAFYYTLAWFDRYLKGDPTGLTRLTATRFDSSADAHSIGAGTFDPQRALAHPTDPLAGNVPYTIAGIPVKDVVSFYYYSEYSLSNPHDQAKLTCLDLRAGCPATQPKTP